MTRGINKYILILLFVALSSFYACNNDVSYTDAVTIPGKEWNFNNVLVFTPLIKDTVISNNIFFTIRTGTSYPYRNIYLFVTTTSPGGKSITDTLQYILADEKGKWYGKGFGDIHELDLPYKTNVFFPSKGTYSFKIQHGMRAENLKGVYDFGLRIEKVKKKV
jgi:gliding motility-associated lipoprotein GldH